MNDRIKKLRKALDLTQQEFADRIGSKRTTIAKYETDTNVPSSAVISLICREFNVSETWLRTGKGEMFAPEQAFDLGEYANRHGMTALETEILKAYLDLDPNVRESLLQHFKERLIRSSPVVDAKDATTTPPDADGQERMEPDLAAKVSELERQNQELVAKVAAMEEEDRDAQLRADFGTALSALQSGLAGNSKKAKNNSAR